MLYSDENRPVPYTPKSVITQVPVELPVFQLSVVQCHNRLLIAKIFKPEWNEIVPEVRPGTFRFFHRELELEDFAKALAWLATERRMGIIPGQLLPGLAGWQRRTLDPINKYDNPVTIECPPRSYLICDLDGVDVPHGLGSPDKVAEAGYYIRDKLFPPCFRGIRGIATATARTGFAADIARLRLWFLTSEPYDIDILLAWLGTLKRKRPDLSIDPSVMDPNHITYTARPVFMGWSDPVPEWGRVRLLDGYEDYVTLDMTGVRPRRHRRYRQSFHRVEVDVPEDLLEVTAQDEGLGVPEIIYELTDKGREAIHRAFETLDSCPKGDDDGRHLEMLKVAWELVNLYFEQEITKRFAMRTFLAAAKNIKASCNGQTYTILDIKDHLRSAFKKLEGW